MASIVRSEDLSAVFDTVNIVWLLLLIMQFRICKQKIGARWGASQLQWKLPPIRPAKGESHKIPVSTLFQGL